MTATHVCLILEALANHCTRQGDREAAVFATRTVVRLPVVKGRARRAAWEQLRGTHLLQRGPWRSGEELTPAGVALARQVGYAVHTGAALPCLPEVAL
jgi:hypothetical protein